MTNLLEAYLAILRRVRYLWRDLSPKDIDGAVRLDPIVPTRFRGPPISGHLAAHIDLIEMYCKPCMRPCSLRTPLIEWVRSLSRATLWHHERPGITVLEQRNGAVIEVLCISSYQEPVTFSPSATTVHCPARPVSRVCVSYLVRKTTSSWSL